MIKHTFFAISIGLIIFFLYLLQYTGAFKSVTVGQDQRGPYTVIYKNHQGAYHKIVPVIQEVETWVKSQNLKCRLSFGEYLDNPQLVEEGRLRSRGGCLVDPENQEELKTFEEVKQKLPEGFSTDLIPQKKYVMALFTGSPGIGPMKVYPKLDEYVQEHKIKVDSNILEIYEVLGPRQMITTYLWPVKAE